MQIDLEPEHRARVASIQGVFIVGLELRGGGRRDHIRDGEGIGRVFEHLHGSAQRQALRVLVKLDGVGEHRQPAQQ